MRIAAPELPITFEPSLQRFYLHTRNTSYVLRLDNGEPMHEHWGAQMTDLPPPKPLPGASGTGWQHTLSMIAREFPDAGRGDTRVGALRIETARGHSACALKYNGHHISLGKPPLAGLPSTFAGSAADVCTLHIRLSDAVVGLGVSLYYTVFPEHDAVARHTELSNIGTAPFTLRQATSFSVDLPPQRYKMLQLSGAWARERQEVWRDVQPGELRVESRAGFSGHEHNPFVALACAGADETHGEVLGLSLVYSGAFCTQVEENPQGLVRLLMGLSPAQFSWRLLPGKVFTTPEAVGIFSGQGIGEMSRKFHDLFRQHLIRSLWQVRPRPVLVNNWEATYFDFTAADIARLAEEAKPLGINLLVLDDGWFGCRHPRNTDDGALGDWVVNTDKLPEGVSGLGQRVNQIGLDFGLWVEPEMVSVKSALYEQHPDWCLHVPQQARTEQRNQLVLDVSRTDVQDYLIEVLLNLFASAPITYVKWDLNRAMHEVGSDTNVWPPEIPHRYMLGLYRVLDRLTQAFPHILFESCASGGGRFDPGMLYYMPQVWTSDNTDGARRLSIQWGTSQVYPASAMGAHVSAVPDHTERRVTPLHFRAYVAMMAGGFGYELDLSCMTDAEKVRTHAHVALYKTIQPLVLHGDLHRLQSPFHSNWPAALYVGKDGAEAVLFAFQMQARTGVAAPSLRLTGLAPQSHYRIEPLGLTLSGQSLMSRGLDLQFVGDHDAQVLQICRFDLG